MLILTELIRTALDEDLGEHGDITTLATVDPDATGQARIVAKASGIIAGGFIVEQVFRLVDPKLTVNVLCEDGSRVEPGQDVVIIHGPQCSILTGERTALNFLCHLSGIASLTAQFVEQVKGTKVRILDTRKTSPGMRAIEKYAVKMGGGHNHRIGLYDMILIKENHITAAGGITPAVNRCREYTAAKNIQAKLEVETRNLDEVKEALTLHVDRIMLDNMKPERIREAVALVNGAVKLEVSGGIDLDSIREIAETGVDYISIGKLTHSANSLDFSLLMD
ncbi:carboxylating nicotinate-nucleotide diphosphorylase [candidate division KSB1 bacterium]|nr:carboxylating nicotinate-nucleotide diphosphorylase [candidate division KSB1 bacterium]